MEYNIKKFIADYISRTKQNRDILMSVVEKNQSISKNHSFWDKLPEVFEVTHLLNSFFGILIVPFEAFNTRRVTFVQYSEEKNTSRENEEKNRRAKLLEQLKSSDHYQPIAELIKALRENKRYEDNYQTRSNLEPLEKDEVFIFLKRLRNSLSHGGKEGLSFLPISIDIESKEAKTCQLTHVIFHDEYIRNEQLIGESYIKLKIKEIELLYELISELFKDIKQELAFTPDQYQKRVEDAEYFLVNKSRRSDNG